MEENPVKRLILVIEGNPQQAQLIETALSHPEDGRHEIMAIADTEQALDFLHRRGLHQGATRPDLILLDLQPDQGGRSLLSEIKTSPYLKRIPIIVFTTSNHTADILESYTLQGNCYVIKPTDLEHLAQVVKHIEDFWLEIVTLPME